MSKLVQMMDAHKNIYAAIKEIQESVNQVDENAVFLAKSISRLAGMLKIHLMNEDKFLYPAMKNSKDDQLKQKASKFQDEMGSLSQDFMTFKDKYNTQSKLLNDPILAKKEITSMCDTILKRMHKEDHDLYPLAEKVM